MVQHVYECAHVQQHDGGVFDYRCLIILAMAPPIQVNDKSQVRVIQLTVFRTLYSSVSFFDAFFWPD